MDNMAISLYDNFQSKPGVVKITFKLSGIQEAVCVDRVSKDDTVEPRLSGLGWTGANSPDNRESGNRIRIQLKAIHL